MKQHPRDDVKLESEGFSSRLVASWLEWEAKTYSRMIR